MADTENVNFMKNLMSKMEGNSTSSDKGKKTTASGKDIITVSYTHLTLPTNSGV